MRPKVHLPQAMTVPTHVVEKRQGRHHQVEYVSETHSWRSGVATLSHQGGNIEVDPVPTTTREAIQKDQTKPSDLLIQIPVIMIE